MSLMRSFDIVKSATRHIAPPVDICAATGQQAELARPWAIMSGQSDFDVVQFSDGGTKHAPEVVAHLREVCAVDPVPDLLIFAHRGHQIECMMPLLASLLNAIDHRGKAHAIRMDSGETDAEAERRLRRFALAQMPVSGHAVLVDDRQDRIGPKGSLCPGEVRICRLSMRPISEITV